MTALLDVQAVRKVFGGLVAVNDVTFSVPEKAIVSVIGPNGAGKTTFFNMITGIYKPTAGTIQFDGRNMIGLRPDEVVTNGIARTFQNIRLFGAMTTLENVLVGRHTQSKTQFFDALLHTARYKSDERAGLLRAKELLEFVGLLDKRDELAANLPYGEQQIGRAHV